MCAAQVNRYEIHVGSILAGGVWLRVKIQSRTADIAEKYNYRSQ